MGKQINIGRKIKIFLTAKHLWLHLSCVLFVPLAFLLFNSIFSQDKTLYRFLSGENVGTAKLVKTKEISKIEDNSQIVYATKYSFVAHDGKSYSVTNIEQKFRNRKNVNIVYFNEDPANNMVEPEINMLKFFPVFLLGWLAFFLLLFLIALPGSILAVRAIKEGESVEGVQVAAGSREYRYSIDGRDFTIKKPLLFRNRPQSEDIVYLPGQPEKAIIMSVIQKRANSVSLFGF